MLRWLILLMAVLAIGLFCVTESHALIIGPARLEARLPAGEVAGIDYYAQNDTESPAHITVEPENWAKDSYDYGSLAAGDWLKIDTYQFDLKPKEIKKLKLTVRIPKTAKGELVAQIFFTSGAVGAEAALQGGVRARLGAVLYISIKGTEKPMLEIKGIDVKTAGDEKSASLKIVVTAQNEGNVHIHPASGILTIYDDKGRQVARVNMAPEHSVLPGKVVEYPAAWDNPALNEGKYSISCEIKYGKMYGREKIAKFEKIMEVDKEGKVLAK